MTELVALCGTQEVLIVDLRKGIIPLSLPSQSNDLEKSRDPNHKCAGQVLVAAISASSKYCVAADDSKRVFVFDITNVEAPRLITEFSVPRRPSCCTFSSSEDAVLIADKSGDVYRATLEPPQIGEPDLILGHVSIITDMQISPSGFLLATADRDEKVRISRYPNCYNIETFLLSHQGFVSRVCFSPCGRFLCSAGSDGLLLLWLVEEARCLTQLDFRQSSNSPDAIVNGLNWFGEHLALSFEGLSTVEIVHVDTNSPSLKLAYDLECGAVIRRSFALRDGVLLLTEHESESLMLLRLQDKRFQKCSDDVVLKKMNADFGDQLRNSAQLYPALMTLKKCPVDKTGLEVYTERKQEIQKNVLARRTRHMQMKAKRQRKEGSPEVPAD